MEAAEPIVRIRRVRQFRTTQEKRFIVEETRKTGVSVATVAQAHGGNANQVFYWRKLYEAGPREGTPWLAPKALEKAPLSGHVFAFRGRRGDLIKLLWFDGDGLCLFSKKLERGRFVWPQAESGKVSLTRAQLSMLLEGIDWRRPDRTWQPAMTV